MIDRQRLHDDAYRWEVVAALMRDHADAVMPQVLIWLLSRESVRHNEQDGMADGEERAFLAPPCGNALIWYGHVGLLRLRRDMRPPDPHLTQPSPALAGLPA